MRYYETVLTRVPKRRDKMESCSAAPFLVPWHKFLTLFTEV